MGPSSLPRTRPRGVKARPPMVGSSSRGSPSPAVARVRRWSRTGVHAALNAVNHTPPRREYDALARDVVEVVPSLVRRVLRPYAVRFRRDPGPLGHDLSQEVSMMLLTDSQELRRWDPERGLSLDRFINVLALRLVARHFRTKCRNEWLHDHRDPHTLDAIETPLPTVEEWLWLWEVRQQVLSDASDRDKQLYEALFVDQLPGAQVAQAHGMSSDAVYQWRHRFKKSVERRQQEQRANAAAHRSTRKESP